MTCESRTERAHAKINLVLRILAREASGYHGIETLFQLLELHDLVHVRVGMMPPALTCAGPTMPAGGLGPVEQNLAWRAAVAYTAASGWNTGWEIEIDKQIPVGGGLGGGSADAAAVLRALEALSPAPLGMERLLQIAGTLGADVPFLVSGESLAWAWGRGDRLMPLPTLPTAAVLLAVFPDGVNTGAAYGAFARAREARGDTVQACAYPASAFASWESIAAVAANDFEPVVSEMHAGVALVLPWFREMAATARRNGSAAIGMMSGSGATCFVLHTGGVGMQVNLPVTFLQTLTR
ncbi:4-(cytidine 5'-diphospho)-2-C-methyl-D-erythritol kinase [Gemmatimonas groenlandica]|uniref:4-diphosphocytidyl-2-C-methyl-D-erythritol kinase n=1 Tax=Gemmatimonas groenlandica TaxID=2732249 RepID=A0A6M4IPW9_9BACT|nr:4-(cytidine 5'-diphospho)-2-C-methyl-D-erythritol kinase [Gemmatimonas groenlandica]QJR35476.1 4-(cytidine 5'-diphospho)-2-C-methyl-D-erythritol kinase [Gemmatimonas groenlandica]